MHGLTQSYIVDKSQLECVLLYNKNLVNEFNSPYFLLIYSVLPKSTKISVYSIKNIPVMKIIVEGSQITETTIDDILKLLNIHDLTILHTSGIVYNRNVYVYEIFFSGIEHPVGLDIQTTIQKIPGIEFFDYVLLYPQEK